MAHLSVRNPNKHVLFTLSLLCSFSFLFGQDSTLLTQAGSRLKILPGYTQTINYSEGYKARATDIASFLEIAGRFFQKEIRFTPKTTFYVVAPQDWKAVAAEPLKNVYGFPHNVDANRLVVAAEDNDFARSFLPPVDKLPLPLLQQVKKAYQKSDGSYSMMPFFDLLALHELGHSYTAQAGLKMQRNWMGELFVNIMLHTYVAEKQPELLPALEVFPNMVVTAGTSEYKFTSLEDFERLYPTLGMGPKNYGWYQSKLHVAAREIYNSGGKKVLKQLWKALKKHQKKMTDEEFIDMLKREVHPSVANVYVNWNSN